MERVFHKKPVNRARFFQDILNYPDRALQFFHSSLTNNYTYFFREPETLQFIVKDIFTTGKKHPLIWCAGCSTGEEPYSLALLLSDAPFTIVASDINDNNLKTASKGEYLINKIQNPQYLRSSHIVCGKKSFTISKSLRKKVKIKRLDLTCSLNFQEKFDYILCRNVLIYLKERKKVLNNLLNNLAPGGYLLMGNTEKILHHEELSSAEHPWIQKYTPLSD